MRADPRLVQRTCAGVGRLGPTLVDAFNGGSDVGDQVGKLQIALDSGALSIKAPSRGCDVASVSMVSQPRQLFSISLQTDDEVSEE
jgi:hypothetical protein